MNFVVRGMWGVRSVSCWHHIKCVSDCSIDDMDDLDVYLRNVLRCPNYNMPPSHAVHYATMLTLCSITCAPGACSSTLARYLRQISANSELPDLNLFKCRSDPFLFRDSIPL